MDAPTHRWWIDPAEVERHVARRGRRHAFEHIDPSRTALVVVDMISFFVDENPYACGIVPHVNALAGAVRSAGGTVAWVVPAVVGPTARDRELFGGEVAERYARSGGAGAPADRLAPPLVVDPGDLAFEKRSRGAFFQGSCDLDAELRRRSIDTVIVAGAAADVCCESTVREAFSCGYRVVMVADANATGSDDALNATLRTVYRSFGDVRTTDELIPMLSPSGSDPVDDAS